MAAAMFYLASYALMNIGAFAVISHVAARNERHVQDRRSRRPWRNANPVMAALLAVFVFSLIGVPLTGGFFGKFYVFQAALDSHLVWLTVLGLAEQRHRRLLLLEDHRRHLHARALAALADLPKPSPSLRIALWASAAGVLILGIFPSTLLTFVSTSAAALR